MGNGLDKGNMKGLERRSEYQVQGPIQDGGFSEESSTNGFLLSKRELEWLATNRQQVHEQRYENNNEVRTYNKSSFRVKGLSYI